MVRSTIYQLPDWFLATAPDVRSAMCADWIGAVGGLARLAPLAAFGAETTPQDEARRWRQIGLDTDCAPLVAQFDRLLALTPRCSGAVSPVHGDSKIANMMFADGRLTAVLDWELGYNGDPLCDLGYLLFFFASPHHEPARASHAAGMFTRDQVIAAWEAASGRSSAGVGWYEALALGKIAAIVSGGYHIYASGQSDDPRFLRFRDRRDEAILAMQAQIDAIAA